MTSDNMYVDTSCGGATKPGRPTDVLALQGGGATMTLAPNPASDQVVVSYSFNANSRSRMIEVYDLTGRVVTRHEAEKAEGEWLLQLDRLL